MSWGKLPTSGDVIVATNPDFDSIRVGDIVGGDYIQVDTDGSVMSFGEATHWDDLRVNADATSASGSNPPTESIFLDNGQTVVGDNYAMSFLSKSSGNLLLPNNSHFDTGNSYSFEFWVRPTVSTQSYIELVRKRNAFSIDFWGNDNLYLVVNNLGTVQTSVPFNRGAWNHVVYTLESNVTSVARIYLNGQERGVISSGGSPVANTEDILFNRQETLFDLDYIAFWNTTLSPEEVLDRYAGGVGAQLTGFENDLQGVWELNDGGGSTIVEKTGNSTDGYMSSGTETTHWDWIDGKVGNTTSGSRGVILKYFSPDITNEVFFTAQMPHSWSVGSDIHPHIHFVTESDGGAGDRVRWGMEYTWASIGAVFNNTTIIYGNNNYSNVDIIANRHMLTKLGSIDGSEGPGMSSMLICRVFRDAESSLDTYDGHAALLEIDFHYQIDSNGSRQEYVK